MARQPEASLDSIKKQLGDLILIWIVLGIGRGHFCSHNVTPGELNGAQVEAMKLNVLTHIQKAGTKQLISLVHDLVEKDSNIGVSTKAQELVNLLKN